MSLSFSKLEACNLIIFGAKGDLVRRKLLPSLYYLEKIGMIHPKTRIIGVGRSEWDIAYDGYSKIIRFSLETFMQECINEALWINFISRFNFCNLDVTQIKDFTKLIKKLDQRIKITISYLAVPPDIFGFVCRGLGEVGLNKEPNRIVIEKPLGTDLLSFNMINDQISYYFNENQIYRIDHYLGKESVLNLFALRFSNSLFFSNWNNSIVDHVEITVAEEVGIEGRWGYFDKVGQMKDMIQSHLLQILTIVAMSPPLKFSYDYICDEKVKVLRSLRLFNSECIKDKVVRGQYVSGYIRGKKVLGYLEEQGAKKDSYTETFIAIRVDIDNWRWLGVPFYLRTGKRLPKKYSEIVVYFKSPLINLFSKSNDKLLSNKLIIRLDPDLGVDIEIFGKEPSLYNDYALKNIKLEWSFTTCCTKENVMGAYERLLLEVMCGFHSFFVRRDEVEHAWRWVDSVAQVWNNSSNNLYLYPAGTWGPYASVDMIVRDGYSWNRVL